MKTSNSRLFKIILIVIVLAILAYGVRYAWISLPIITGYSAKMACSCVFLSNRELASVQGEELGKSPLKFASLTLNTKDSTVTASILGLAKQKAIYRHGLGCTLVNELTEEDIRKQQFNLASFPVINQDTIDWPLGNRVSDNFQSGVDRDKLKQAIQFAFTEKDPDKLWRTRAVVVVYDGQLVGEQYSQGFDRKTRQLSWSMAKSITSALTGILVGEGKLKVKEPAPVPEWRSVHDGREKITLENILQQTTGLAFEENYTKSTNATNMLFRKADMGGYTAGLPLKNSPGSVFYYTSGNTNLLSRIIRQTVGEQQYHAFPANALFIRTGMLSAVMEPDASGTFIGSSYVFANALDWARFGLLYANDGMVGNERILPAGWVTNTITPVSCAPQGEYGYKFWLNAGAKGNITNRKYPSLPTDLYYADGYEGQYVFVIPSKKLVVVRLGQTAGDNFNVDDFLTGIINAVR